MPRLPLPAPARTVVLVVVLVATALGLGGCAGGGSEQASSPGSSTSASTSPPAPVTSSPASPAPASPSPASPAQPLHGVRIALDPGHQLGNSHFPSEINRLVESGDGSKACNTTGTATNAGVPEATVNWQVAMLARRRLERLGATVLLTRRQNSSGRWGPCVDVRGHFPDRANADLMVSLHADGSLGGGHGFHVIVPTATSLNSDGVGRSRRLGRDLRAALTRAGIDRSTYVGSGTGMVTRGDLGTLNLSSRPVAMIEMGNMREADDARRLTHPAGQRRYADAVVACIRAFLRR